MYRSGEPWWLGKEEERELDDLNRYFEAGDEIEDLQVDHRIQAGGVALACDITALTDPGNVDVG